MPPSPNESARDLLRFQIEAGIDCALGDVPINWLAEPLTAPGADPAEPARDRTLPSRGALPPRSALPARGSDASGAAAPAVAASAAPAPPDAAIQSARSLTRQAPTLDELRKLMESFDGCALKATASRLVFADGVPGARVMLVGEAPGRDEDIQGLPFVGRSGQLLDRMLAAIGLDRQQVYIANIIPWRPPGNRTPTPQETQICLPFVQRQIELANPDILVCLGNPSTQTLLNTRDGIMKTRGRWFDYATGTRTIRALPTFHPAYLLRSPIYKRMAWQDLRAIRKALDTASTPS